MKEPARHIIHNIELEPIERAVYRQDYEGACTLLVQALQRLKLGAGFIGHAPDPITVVVCYTRLVSALLAMLADPKMAIGQQGLDMIGAEHAIIDVLIKASGLRTSDHLLTLIADNPDEARDKWRASGPSMIKFLTVQSMASRYHMDFVKAFSGQPQVFFGIWCGMLSAMTVMTEESSKRHEELAGLHRVFEGCTAATQMLPATTDAFMYSSYALRPDKHDIKRTILTVLRRGLSAHDIPVPSAEVLAAQRAELLETRRKPVMLVALEWFGEQHAMFRCYAPVLRQLRGHYHLVGMCRAIDIDDGGKAELDEWVEIDQTKLVLSQIAGQVNDIRPDVIWHPSIGMAMWWVALSTLRLAPIQLMTLGHPATSMCDEMDYVVCDDAAVSTPGLFSERIVTVPNGSFRFVARTDVAVPEPCRVDPEDGTINIAVPAMLCKVTVPFLRACKAVQQQAKRPIRWHFFINMAGLNLLQAAREIRAWLPEALTYERSTYDVYMGHLRGCQLNACTFPFGGTNSNIDAMQLGIPLVCMEGMEPHERFDAMMARRAGLPDGCIAHSEQEWIESLLGLIESDDHRHAMRDHLLAFDLQAEFFGPPPNPTAFRDAIDLIMQRHEDFQLQPQSEVIDSTQWGKHAV